MSQEESRDIIGNHLAKTKRGIAKALGEEPPDERPVPGHSYRRKAAFFLEVGLIALSQCCQGGSVHRRRWRCNNVLVAQVLQEVLKGWCVNPAATALAAALLQEAADDGFVQIDKCQAVSVKPSVEMIQEPELLSHRGPSITQLAACGDKRVQVRAKKASPQAFYGGSVRKKIIKHTSSP